MKCAMTDTEDCDNHRKGNIMNQIQVYCHTNLDLLNEKWPDFLPSVPNVGDEIQSDTKWNHGFQLTLRVCSITWKRDERNGWGPFIELGMTKWQGMLWPSKEGAAQGSIVAFYEWYAPKVGKTVNWFI